MKDLYWAKNSDSEANFFGTSTEGGSKYSPVASTEEASGMDYAQEHV